MVKTAGEKRKYAARLLEPLASYGYFIRQGAVWKCSMDGKYAASIAFDLTRAGMLNEVDIKYGSFYSTGEAAETFGDRDGFSDVPLAFYVRNVGQDRPLLDPGLSFEKQVESILPYFQNIILPLIPIHDELGDFCAGLSSCAVSSSTSPRAGNSTAESAQSPRGAAFFAGCLRLGVALPSRTGVE